MENFNSMEIKLSTSEIAKLSSIIKVRGIWFKSIELEYRKKNRMLLIRFVGAKYMKLSDKYVQMIESQLDRLQREFLTPLLKYANSNFILFLSVNAQGHFSFSDTSLKFKLDCGRGLNVHDTFREPFAVLLPYALYITNIEFRGHKHRPVVVEAEMKITPDELDEIIQLPLVAPCARNQWYNIGSTIYEEAKKEYYYQASIPCIEGELIWDNKVDTIQITVFENPTNIKVL